MSLEEHLKKLIKDAVVRAMAGVNGRIETLTDSVSDLRKAILQEPGEEAPDEIDIARALLKSLPPLPEGGTITIHTKEDF